MPVNNNSSNDGLYLPSEEILINANVKEYEKLYAESIKDREKFWSERAE